MKTKYGKIIAFAVIVILLFAANHIFGWSE